MRLLFQLLTQVLHQHIEDLLDINVSNRFGKSMH